MNFSFNGSRVISTYCTALWTPNLCECCHVLPVLIHFLPVLLSFSDLSSNPFDCDCKLFRLVSWLQERGVRVRRPDAMLCNHPPELRHQPLLNVSLLTCGMKQIDANSDMLDLHVTTITNHYKKHINLLSLFASGPILPCQIHVYHNKKC